MNTRTIRTWRAALSIAIASLAGPALAGLDITPPRLPPDLQASGSIDLPPSEMHEKKELQGLRIVPGLSLSPDFGISSPYAIVDPSTPRQGMEPLIRLQVPIPP